MYPDTEFDKHLPRVFVAILKSAYYLIITVGSLKLHMCITNRFLIRIWLIEFAVESVIIAMYLEQLSESSSYQRKNHYHLLQMDFPIPE